MPPSLKFVRKQDGTGTTLDTTYLGQDEAGPTLDSHTLCAAANWFADPDARYHRVRVETFYFATIPSSDLTEASARTAMLAYVEALRAALKHSEPVLKELPRGKAILLNINQNFGELFDISSGSPVSVLTNCQLLDIKIADDPGVHGYAIHLTFGKLSAASAP